MTRRHHRREPVDSVAGRWDRRTVAVRCRLLEDTLDEFHPADRAEVAQSIELLRAAGLLGDEAPGALYSEWISWTLRSGLGPADVVSRARQEGVSAGTFDIVDGDGATLWRAPSGRPFVRVEYAGSARQLTRVTELLNGGAPSGSDWRRDRNRWSYRGPFGAGHGDAGLVLHHAGALAATPVGTLIAASGAGIGIIPNAVDVFTARAGTTWGDIFVVNGSHDDPASVLRGSIESGRPSAGSGAPSLDRLLRHEQVHSEQWARYGFVRFIWEYVIRHNPSAPCRHPLEREAGLEDGGYRC